MRTVTKASVEFDVEANSDDLLNDDSQSNGDNAHNTNAQEAVTTLTESISSAVSSGDLVEALADSAQEVSEEEGDTELIAAVSAVEVDRDGVSFTDLSPTATPTEVPDEVQNKSKTFTSTFVLCFCVSRNFRTCDYGMVFMEASV